MDCSRISSLFSTGLDQELAAADQAAFDQHLGRCPDCRRQWRLFQATVARVRGLEPLTPPLGILSGIQARLAEAEPESANIFSRLVAAWRRLELSVSLPTAVATVALALIMAFLAKNETFFQYQPGPERLAAANSSAEVGALSYRPALPATIPAAAGRALAPFDTMPTHSPAIRVPSMERPDVLMVLHAAPPEMLPHLFRESAAFSTWRVEYPERELLLVELPSGDLATLRELLNPYPVAVAPVSALSPHFATNRERVRVAIRTP